MNSAKANLPPAQTQKLQKLLAQAGLGSRREMEELIAAGQATINGKVARVGDRVGPTDIVRVGKRVIHIRPAGRLPRVLLYHKPEGEIVSRDDPQGRPSVFDKLPQLRSSKWISIGRLDYNTSGLLIFTTDGELANRLMHPRFEVEREYAVRIIGRLTEEQTRALTSGVELEDGSGKIRPVVGRRRRGIQSLVSCDLEGGSEPRSAPPVRSSGVDGEPPDARTFRSDKFAASFETGKINRTGRGGDQAPTGTCCLAQIVCDCCGSCSRVSRKTSSSPALVSSQVKGIPGKASSSISRLWPISTITIPSSVK